MSRGARYLDDLDLNPLLTRADGGRETVHCTVEGRNEVPDTLDAQMIRDAQPLFTHREKMQLQYSVRNTHRAVGTRLAAMITRKYGMAGLQPDTVTVRLRGTAGQSLGAFAVQGMKLEVFGDANDYVGKGLSGGTIVVRPTISSPLVPQDNAIIGNTVLYGATAGKLFACGPRRRALRRAELGRRHRGRGRGLQRLRVHDRRHRRDPGRARRQLRAPA